MVRIVQPATVTLLSEVADGSAEPSRVQWIGGSDGTNLQGLSVETATNPNLKVVLYNGSYKIYGNATSFDGLGTSGRALETMSVLYGFNNSTWDRLRCEQTGILRTVRDGASSITSIGDVSVTTTAAQLATNAAKEVLIKNIGTNNVRIGDSNVSATRGFQLKPDDVAVFSVNNSNLLYHVAETGTSTLAVVVLN